MAEEISEHAIAINYSKPPKLIMAVDDTPFNNIMIQNMLKLLKIESITKVNGKEAYDYFLGEDREKIGMILMDVNMPVLDGIKVRL